MRERIQLESSWRLSTNRAISRIAEVLCQFEVERLSVATIGHVLDGVDQQHYENVAAELFEIESKALFTPLAQQFLQWSLDCIVAGACLAGILNAP